jgi:flavodoxin
MKTLIIYESVHHGNTERVARAMADALGAKLVKPSDVSPGDLTQYDLIGFGSGIYFGRHHKNLRRFVKRLQPMNKNAFVFSSCGANRNQNRGLIARLAHKGFSVKGDFFCPGFDTMGPFFLIGGLKKGRPNAADLQAAREFAGQLAAKLEAAA